MKMLSRDMVCYAMSADAPPALRVAPGERFGLETEDCYSGMLRSPEDVFTSDMWDTVNPATGPVCVEGAQSGDVLRVDVESIRTRDWAVMCVEHGAGALAEQVEGVETAILPIRDGKVIVREGLAVPVRPMIGVIGTAPAGEAVLNGTPGEHGGNLDCREIGPGARVYLPVGAPGALLAAGDVHALMGDGEVCICAAEVSAEVILSATPVRTALPTPCVETADWLAFLGSALTLDECERIVLAKAHRFLTESAGLGPNEAARFMSLLGELRVCQVVDPLKTMKLMLPRPALAACGLPGEGPIVEAP